MLDCSVNRAYIERLALDVKRSASIVEELTSKPYEAMSEVEKYAVRYHLIVIAEAIMSMAMHVTRRALHVEVESASHALRVLRDRNFISSEEYEKLLSFIRSRNLLVHRYWVIDDEKIYNHVKSDFKAILNLVERIISYAGES